MLFDKKLNHYNCLQKMDHLLILQRKIKGRELQHSHLGNELMTKIKEDMKDISKVELHPKFDGKQMIMVIQPL